MRRSAEVLLLALLPQASGLALGAPPESERPRFVFTAGPGLGSSDMGGVSARLTVDAGYWPASYVSVGLRAEYAEDSTAFVFGDFREHMSAKVVVRAGTTVRIGADTFVAPLVGVAAGPAFAWSRCTSFDVGFGSGGGCVPRPGPTGAQLAATALAGVQFYFGRFAMAVTAAGDTLTFQTWAVTGNLGFGLSLR